MSLVIGYTGPDTFFGTVNSLSLFKSSCDSFYLEIKAGRGYRADVRHLVSQAETKLR